MKKCAQCADRRFLLYHRARQQDHVLQQTGYDVWIVPMEGDRNPRPYLQSKFDEKFARFSPDGHWVAYVSTETGRAEVYVREFADPAATAMGAQFRNGELPQFEAELTPGDEPVLTVTVTCVGEPDSRVMR